jgi:hypothetical protein
MDDTLFQYIIDHQPIWKDQAIQQKQQERIRTDQLNKEKNWYGKSKEYKREWTRLRKDGLTTR